MRSVMDIKAIQNLNLFEKITGAKARCCFNYNSTMIFVVPRHMLNQALGRNASNINRLSIGLNKRVRIITSPSDDQDIRDIERFVRSIVYPYDFKNAMIENDELVIFSLPRTKAALIGRDKTRLKELTEVVDCFFGIKKIVIK
jgi:NusA-like KH domain protein